MGPSFVTQVISLGGLGKSTLKRHPYKNGNDGVEVVGRAINLIQFPRVPG